MIINVYIYIFHISNYPIQNIEINVASLSHQFHLFFDLWMEIWLPSRPWQGSICLNGPMSGAMCGTQLILLLFPTGRVRCGLCSFLFAGGGGYPRLATLNSSLVHEPYIELHRIGNHKYHCANGWQGTLIMVITQNLAIWKDEFASAEIPGERFSGHMA